jgi:hypothetical protein
MSPNPRKRSSAFDDFPVPEEQSLPESATNATHVQKPQPKIERIERLKPSEMLPDRFQPRRLLPASIRPRFFSHQIDCYQAAAEWLHLGQQDAGNRLEIERLLSMGDSFDDHGQIKPITGSWTSQEDGRYIFLIETGERRYWAACLHAVKEKLVEEPLLRVEVVNKPTRQRQVLENRHAEPPSAVGQACEVASLILAEMSVPADPNIVDEFEYFRQSYRQRMPNGLWERIIPVMQLTRPRMVQLLNILQLPSNLLEIADRYRLPERVLREILSVEPDKRETLLRLAVSNSLTSDDVRELKEPSETEKESRSGRHTSSFLPPQKLAANNLRRFASLLGEMDEYGRAQALDEIADMLVISGLAEGLMNVLGELAGRVDARITRR